MPGEGFRSKFDRRNTLDEKPRWEHRPLWIEDYITYAMLGWFLILVVVAYKGIGVFLKGVFG